MSLDIQKKTIYYWMESCHIFLPQDKLPSILKYSTTYSIFKEFVSKALCIHRVGCSPLHLNTVRH